LTGLPELPPLQLSGEFRLSFLGGMPTCHGAGGLAGQYYFGARTGGTNIIDKRGKMLLERKK